MPLERSDFPISSFQEVASALRRQTREKPGSPAAIESGDALARDHPGHRLYMLGMNQIEAGDGIEAAIPIGWRYVLTPRNAEAFLAETGERAGKHRFSFFSSGDHARMLIRVWDSVKHHPILTTGDYELRGLRIPALLVEAFWLKDRHGDRDVIVPIMAGNKSVLEKDMYSRVEFLDQLRKLLPKRLRFARRRALH